MSSSNTSASIMQDYAWPPLQYLCIYSNQTNSHRAEITVAISKREASLFNQTSIHHVTICVTRHRPQFHRIKIQFVFSAGCWPLYNMWKMLKMYSDTPEQNTCQKSSVLEHRSSVIYSLERFKSDIIAKVFPWTTNWGRGAFSSSRKTIRIQIFSSLLVPTSQLLSSELTKLWADTFLSTMINLTGGYLNALTSCVFTIVAPPRFWEYKGLLMRLHYIEQFGIHLWPVRLHGWNQAIALNKVTQAHFLTPLNARIIKTCCSLASEWRSLIPASSPRPPRWPYAQRAGHQDGWACGWLSCCPDGSLSEWAQHQEGRHPDVRPRLDTLIFIRFPPDTCGLSGETRGWWYWSPAESVCVHFKSQLTLSIGSVWIFIGCRF